MQAIRRAWHSAWKIELFGERVSELVQKGVVSLILLKTQKAAPTPLGVLEPSVKILKLGEFRGYGEVTEWIRGG